jgi:hypothetical protein
MKKKTLKKIIENSISNSLNYRNDKYDPIAEKNSYNDFIFTNSNDETKKRSRNLIYRIISLRDKLNFHISDNSININSELSRLKNTNHKSSPTSIYSDEYFSLEIIKNVGYLLSFNEQRLGFKDESLYDDTIDQIRTTFDQLNQENFLEIYSKIMKDSGLARNSNLDELLEN